MKEPYHVIARWLTVHYRMGVLRVDTKTQVIDLWGVTRYPGCMQLVKPVVVSRDQTGLAEMQFRVN